jgi:predicted permease
MWGRIIRRLRHLLFGAQTRQELDEEMAFHLEALTRDLIRQGMDPAEARREARIRFGAPEWVHQRAREERGLALFDETARNVRMALRRLARDRLFASTFVLTLALCIGMATAVFGVVDSVLWRSLPYPAPDRLAQAVLFNPAFGKNPGSTGADGFTWERIRDEAAFLERAVYSGWARGVNLSTDEAAAFVQQQRVGAGYFGTLGVTPVLGREFTAAEDVPEGPQVAILSHELWIRTFHGDPDLLGTTIRLKGAAHTVVGIMPPGFSSPAEADIWTPLRPSTRGEGSGTNYGILVRIPRSMSFEEADARVAAIAPPQAEEGAPELRMGLVPLDEALNAGMRTPMLILLGGILLMFVVGCANLAGLQIARSLARQPEMATRQALGSGTGALVRQTIVENLVLGILGGGLGLGLAFYGMSGVEALVQGHFGIWQSVNLDGRALSVTLAVTLSATVLFGLVPVLRVARPGAYRVLVSGARVMGGSGHLLRKMLLVGQVAMVTALLFGAGLLVRSYGFLEGLDPGFNPEDVLSVQFSLEDARYTDAESVDRLFNESLEAIRRIPGVTSAAVTLSLPYERPLNMGFRFPDEEDYRVVNVVYVTPGFFETLDIPLSQGRAFSDVDRRGEPISVVVNEAFVRTHLTGEDPLGRRINIGFAGEDGATVVGVVGNVQQSAGWGDTNQPVWETPTVYSAAAQMSGGFFRGIHIWFSPSWVIRTARSSPSVPPQVTEVFRQAAPDLPVARTVTLSEVVDAAFAQQRFEASFLLTVALLAMILAGIGLYGIVAHEVLERRTEMGLRMALGASPGSAVWKTGLSGVRLTVLGLLVGALGAVGVSRVMGHVLFGVEPFDPVVLAGLAVVLAVLASVASFVPAARVGRMDPARILREG